MPPSRSEAGTVQFLSGHEWRGLVVIVRLWPGAGIAQCGLRRGELLACHTRHVALANHPCPSVSGRSKLDLHRDPPEVIEERAVYALQATGVSSW
jgi:hypothetical protein